MIKQTYINLSKEKKEILLNAAKKEFTKYPLHNASINRIIKNVGIARGSYYNYFDNIEDLYFCVFNSFREKLNEHMDNAINKSNGDIFEAFEEGFNYLLKMSKEEYELFKNMFLNMNSEIQKYLSPLFKEDFKKAKLAEIKGKTTFDNLKINTDFDLIIALDFLNEIMFQTTIKFYMENMNVEDAKKLFNRKLEILKYGICKK